MEIKDIVAVRFQRASYTEYTAWNYLGNLLDLNSVNPVPLHYDKYFVYRIRGYSPLEDTQALVINENITVYVKDPAPWVITDGQTYDWT